MLNMPRPLSRRNHRSGPGARGQATVEFALVVPLLLLVAAAICQVALALNCYLVITGASREGARRGAETNSAEEAKAAAADSCSGLPGEPPGIEVSFPRGRSRGMPVTVTIVHRMPLLIPGLSGLVPDATLRGTTSMALEVSR